jgi:tetratricopeptide (TPR) repeat protein
MSPRPPAIRLNPQDKVAHIHLGALLTEQGRPQEAEAAYREAVRLNPQFAVGHKKLGNLLKEQGRPGEAEAAFREVIRLNPHDEPTA